MSYEKQIEKDIVSENLRFLLNKNNKKQIDLVRDLGLSQSIISEYLNAKKYPAPDKMQLLADYFGVMKSDIMQEKPATNKDDELTDEQRNLLNFLRGLNPEHVQEVLDFARFRFGKKPE